MSALLRQLLEVCLLRRGPQDLPYAPSAVGGLVLALLALQLGFAAYLGLPAQALAARALVTVVLLLGVTQALLRWRGLENRRMQTLLALAGSTLFFALAMMPLLLSLQPYLGAENPPASVLLSALAAMFLFFWKLRVEAAIWRQSLDLASGQAYALALALVLAEALLMLWLVPAGAPVSGAPGS